MTAPYYTDGQVTLYHGDVRNGLGAFGIGPASAACAVWSPPYNAGIDYDGWCDAMAWPAYRHLARCTAELVAAALVDGGRAWCNVAPVVPAEVGEAGEHSGYTGKAR